MPALLAAPSVSASRPARQAPLAGLPAACRRPSPLRAPLAPLCGLLAAAQLAAAPGTWAVELSYPLPASSAAAAAAPQRPAAVAAFALAEAAAAPAPAVSTPEQQAAFESAQQITGQKWLAYLAAWSGWLAWDLYRQNSQKAAGEQQQGQEQGQQDGAAAVSGGESGAAAGKEPPQKE